MKLVDKMKDENLGLAVLYNFTKGYGHVPMNVYDLVLPLIYNDTFRNSLSAKMSVQESIEKCKKEDEEFFAHFMEEVEKDKEMTSKSLGICLLNQYLSFEFEDNQMKGIVQNSKILDLNEAIVLGQYFSGKDYDEIINELKKNIRIVFLDSLSLGEDIDLSPLSQYGKVVTYPKTQDDEIIERIKKATIVLTNKCVLTQEILQHAPELQLICITATGTNNVDLDYCHAHQIAVCNVSGYSTQSVAQHTLALLLTLNNQIHYYHSYVDRGDYCQSEMFCHLGKNFYELDGKTWGIVGLGAIGKAVGKLASAFGCRVIYYSTSGRNNDGVFKRVDLETLLKESDVISIHSPLTSQTKNLFDRNIISKMKKTAYLVNVGRGGIIDEVALYDALNNNEIAGAALDVFEGEPMKKDNPLLFIQDPSKLLMTPHVAWATVEARNRLFQDVCKNIEGYLKGELRNVC
ncbi:MAG: D-2-hydroxyacid dehydrogenase [Faecalibacillus sp.]